MEACDLRATSLLDTDALEVSHQISLVLGLTLRTTCECAHSSSDVRSVEGRPRLQRLTWRALARRVLPLSRLLQLLSGRTLPWRFAHCNLTQGVLAALLASRLLLGHRLPAALLVCPRSRRVCLGSRGLVARCVCNCATLLLLLLVCRQAELRKIASQRMAESRHE